jgi:hypothetical protein
MSKYQKISEIYSKMTSEFVDERPECDEMLRVSNRSSWVLNAVELLKNGNEFDKIDKMNFGEESYVVTFMSIRIIEELQIIGIFFIKTLNFHNYFLRHKKMIDQF